MLVSKKVLKMRMTCKDRACVGVQVGEYQGAYKVMQHKLTWPAATLVCSGSWALSSPAWFLAYHSYT